MLLPTCSSACVTRVTVPCAFLQQRCAQLEQRKIQLTEQCKAVFKNTKRICGSEFQGDNESFARAHSNLMECFKVQLILCPFSRFGAT